jgi:hypothetical protein
LGEQLCGSEGGGEGARRAVVSMVVENMATAAKGEASAVAAERCSDGHGEDSRVDVYSKSEVSLCCALAIACSECE